MRILLVLISLLPAFAPAQRPLSVPAQHARSPVLVTGLDVSVRIKGPTAHVTQKIVLTNPSGRAREFELTFPLGRNAVVSGLDLTAGDRTLEGTVLAAEAAKRYWRSLVRRYRDPALLEHYGEALFRARVFPVPARGKVTLTLTHDQVVQSRGGIGRLHLPLTAFRRAGTPLQDMKLAVVVESQTPITTLYSPTHDIGRSRMHEVAGDPAHYRAELSVAKQQFALDQDFLLLFKSQSSAELVDVTLLSEKLGAQEAGWFMAVINGVPGTATEPQPRDLVFVLDRSGSMKGRKIEQARAALKFLIERLRPQDRFNLVTYSNTVTVYGEGLQSPSAGVLRDVLAHVGGIEANGGTNIEGALQTALGLFKDDTRANQLVFLTDGLPTVGERNTHKLARLAAEKNARRARIVAFGVGFDVNGSFLDRLAVKSRGLSEYILPSENIEERVPDFYSRMQSPLVLDTTISVSMPGAGPHVIHDVFPREVGDIYGGHQIILTGRYARAGKALVTITGRRGREPFELKVPVTLAADASQGREGLVARIWAARKVGFLVDEIRLNGESQELVKEIVRLGRRWGILTEYTSFLAAPGTELAQTAENVRRARTEVRRKAHVESGSQGVAQAANSKVRQRQTHAATRNRWLDASGRQVEIHGCRNVGGKTFFLRGKTWVDSQLGREIDDKRPAEEVELYTEAFFALLDRHPALNRAIARTGQVTLELDGRLLSFK